MTERETSARALAERASYVVTDERLNILLAEYSSDTEACPGSGKTTTLVLKAALELSRWTSRRQGILVLSHTNAARREVERRAAQITEARGLLAAPHFVGTIQSFIQRFLAYPYLRSHAMPVSLVEDEAAAGFIERLVNKPMFTTARVSLEKRGRIKDVGTLQLGDDGDAITFGGNSIGLSPETPTYQQLLRIKSLTVQAGVFRYGDMYGYALHYIRENPWIKPLMQSRFPMVFLDEVQDNVAYQWAVLDELFPRAKTRVHRFGDSNQAIFGASSTDDADAGGSFPTAPMLPITDSLRFGPFIAEAVSSVALNGLNVIGSGPASTRPHTVIVYEPSKVGDVLNAFAEIVAAGLGRGETRSAIAIGAVKRPPTPAPDGSLRASLGAYYFGFIGGAPRLRTSESLVKQVMIARISLAQDGLASSVETVHRAVRRWLSLCCDQGADDVYRRIEADHARQRALGAFALEALLGGEVTQARWGLLAARLEMLVSGEETCVLSNGSAFLRFDEDTGLGDASAPPNRYIWRDDQDRTVNVDVTTIHAVKGETHDATLVLETYNKTNDLGKVAAYLSGRKPIRRDRMNSAERRRVKQAYVGLSRSKTLVCIALSSKNITARDIESLRLHWNVITL